MPEIADGLRDEIAAAIADHTERCSCCPTIPEPVKLAIWIAPTVQTRIRAAREQVAEQIAQAIEGLRFPYNTTAQAARIARQHAKGDGDG